jgi:dipeptidyl-peptidase-3
MKGNNTTLTHKPETTEKPEDFRFLLEQFADLKILRYQVPGFSSLTLRQKSFIYYLSQAALSGRDIIYDQNYRYNLAIRRTLEHIVLNYKGDRNTPDYEAFMVYVKRVWFSNGIHHHHSKDKFFPAISRATFLKFIEESGREGLPLKPGQSPEDFCSEIAEIIFNPDIAPKGVCQDQGKDLLTHSSVNFYEGLTEKEALDYYRKMDKEASNEDSSSRISFGLNSKLVKSNGRISEIPYRIGGLYSEAIEQIIYWLGKAADYAENGLQQKTIETLISYYQTGDLKTWDATNVMWVNNHETEVDFINGFIENYSDPLGLKATWESLVSYKDMEASKRSGIISANAQWFEDHSPVDPRFRKKEVRGVSAQAINAAQLGGDCYPSSPIGINLPNADWIRKQHGSKSVTIENITLAHEKAALGNGMLEEFAFDEEEIQLAKKYGSLAGSLHTDLHECLGHGSGQLMPGTKGDELKNYGSPLEEARADLFALYYIADPKMTELQLFDTEDVFRAAYNAYIRNGLITQLTRIGPGNNIEQAHMRSRQLIAAWCYDKGREFNVIEFRKKGNKTFVKINSYAGLRALFGELLAEIQRIKSTGDYEAGRDLIENYGVKVNPELHREVLERFSALNIAPYGGFINPVFVPVMQENEITDVIPEYPDSFTVQMLQYSDRYSFLPDYN